MVMINVFNDKKNEYFGNLIVVLDAVTVIKKLINSKQYVKSGDAMHPLFWTIKSPFSFCFS